MEDEVNWYQLLSLKVFSMGKRWRKMPTFKSPIRSKEAGLKNAPFFYSIRLPTVLHFAGPPLIALGFSSLVPFLASFFFREWMNGIPYLFTAIFSLLLGWKLARLPSSLSLRYIEAVVVICGTFLYASCISAIPIYFSGLSVSSAFFEAVSGITTTGLSMIADYSDFPKTTLFARSWLQWIGGLGIIIFSVAVLMPQGEISKRLQSVQTESSEIIAGTKVLAKGIITTYALLTLAGIAIMLMLGSGLYESVLLVFASVSTGGFSNYANSIAALTRLQQTVLLFISFLCAFSLPFYYKLLRERRKVPLEAAQILGLLILASAVSIALGNHFDSWILGFSAQTTTGFSSTNISSLSALDKLILSASMLIGGGVASTAGGFKVLRLIMFWIFMRTLIQRQCQTERLFTKPFFFHKAIPEKSLQLAMGMIICYVIVTIASWFIFVALDYEPIDSLFEVSSALGTVGLSSGITSPDLPLMPKLLLCVNMLLGRLEIIPWLILFHPLTWTGKHLEE